MVESFCLIANGIAPPGFTSESESINQIESEKLLAIAQKHFKTHTDLPKLLAIICRPILIHYLL